MRALLARCPFRPVSRPPRSMAPPQRNCCGRRTPLSTPPSRPVATGSSPMGRGTEAHPFGPEFDHLPAYGIHLGGFPVLSAKECGPQEDPHESGYVERIEREIERLRRRHAAFMRELPDAREVTATWAAEAAGLCWFVPLEDVVEADIDVEITSEILIVRASRSWPEPAILVGLSPCREDSTSSTPSSGSRRRLSKSGSGRSGRGSSDEGPLRNSGCFPLGESRGAQEGLSHPRLEVPSGQEPGRPKAEEKFKELAGAYEVFSDPEKRQEYDDAMTGRAPSGTGPRGASGPGGAPPFESDVESMSIDEILRRFGDIFGGEFGEKIHRSRGAARPGYDAEVELEVEFRTAALGGKVSVSLTGAVSCARCRGRGSLGEHPGCPTCQGSGRATAQARDKGQFFTVTRPCPTCHGTGVDPSKECPDCRGEGTSIERARSTSPSPKERRTGRSSVWVGSEAPARPAVPRGTCSSMCVCAPIRSSAARGTTSTPRSLFRRPPRARGQGTDGDTARPGPIDHPARVILGRAAQAAGSGHPRRRPCRAGHGHRPGETDAETEGVVRRAGEKRGLTAT